jgi:hypothetical protein
MLKKGKKGKKPILINFMSIKSKKHLDQIKKHLDTAKLFETLSAQKSKLPIIPEETLEESSFQDQQIQQQKPMQIKVGNFGQISQMQQLDKLLEIDPEYDAIELNLSEEKENNQTSIEILANHIEHNATCYSDEIYSKCHELKINDYKIEAEGARALSKLRSLKSPFTLTLESCDIDLADFKELLLSNLDLNIINTSIEFNGESIELTEKIARQNSANLNALSTDGKILEIQTKILTEKLNKTKEKVRLTDEKLKQANNGPLEQEIQQKQIHELENPDWMNESYIYQNSVIEQSSEIAIIGENFQ